MEELGECCFFYSENTHAFYKVINIKNTNDIRNFIIQECELKLIDKTLSVLDENKKLTKIVETYEKVPYGRKKQMNWNLYKKLFLNEDYNIFEDYRGAIKTLVMSDKYCFHCF